MAQESNQVNRDSAADAQPADTKAQSPSPTTTQIRAQIEHTRAEITHTIDAIQERVSPSRLMREAKQSVKDATVGRMKRLAAKTYASADNRDGGSVNYKRGFEAVKARPAALVIAGVAATALVTRAMMRSRHESNRHWRHDAPSLNEHRRPVSNPSTNTRRMLLGACAVAAACWGAWRANSRGASAYGARRSFEPSARTF
jgi:uncharacterized protein DUF3618